MELSSSSQLQIDYSFRFNTEIPAGRLSSEIPAGYAAMSGEDE